MTDLNSIEDSYVPTYVDLDDVPVTGPDEYEDGPKRVAIFKAESRLELDVNGGEEIPTDERINAHRVAVMDLATHVLTHGANDPSDVTLGDMASGGGAQNEYSSRFLEEYNSIVESLLETSAGSDSGNYSTAVNEKSAPKSDRQRAIAFNNRNPDYS
jgi:hypothetical protein